MKELLEELKDVDPEAWQKLFDLAWAIVPGKEDGLTESSVFSGACVFRPLLMQDRVLGEVMRAVQAKGWDFDVSFRHLEGYKPHAYHALVAGNGGWTAKGASPAAALLTAYIEALRGGE